MSSGGAKDQGGHYERKEICCVDMLEEKWDVLMLSAVARPLWTNYSVAILVLLLPRSS